MHDMLHDAFRIPNDDVSDHDSGPDDMMGECNKVPNHDAQTFYKLLEDAEQELYPACKRFTKFSFIVRLFHIKCLNGLSDKAVTMLLELIKEALPEGETLPKSFYHAKKIIGGLGLGYKKIDACPNDCMLYWKENEYDSSCSICGASRWKLTSDDLGYNNLNQSSTTTRRVPAKVLRHFPLKPRLQRYFMSKKTSSFMQWHENHRVKDGILRHPADSKAWKSLDQRYPEFALDPRNVRLGLASDGFNPFGTMSLSHSTWPVVLMIYNLPPWMCMKQPNILMSLLIPGPYAPGNDIDVYLQPLINELRELWEDGVNTFDASSNQNFNLRVALLWTISDFPAYANLSGWSTKGRFACPHCNVNTSYQRLKYWHKYCYLGHRRFLEGNAPTPLTGTEVLEQMNQVHTIYGKHKLNTSGKRKRGDINDEDIVIWKKKSIFFMLPYWEHNLIRHNLDVMHIEKNICDSIIGTLLNIKDEAKIAGPVQYRWMYPIERELRKLKSYVRNKCHPEGSIAEGYLAEECLTFCSRYLSGIETKFNQPLRNADNEEGNFESLSIFSKTGRGMGKEEIIFLDPLILSQAHRYVLFNCEEVTPFIKQIDITRIHSEQFPKWFETEVKRVQQEGDNAVSEDLKRLAQGPNRMISRFKKYMINGFRFRIKEVDLKSKTQNSGVVVTAKTSSFASAKDKNPILGDVSYFGRLTDVVELDYYGGRTVTLFKCDWVDVNSGRGIKKDELGFTLVNLNSSLNTDEPFVLATQAIQVFYVADPVEKDWHVAVITKPRDLFNMEENEIGDDGELLVANESYSGQRLEELPDNFDNTALVRDNMPGTVIDTPLDAAEEKSNASSDDFDSDDDNRMVKRKRPNYHASFMVERSPISKQSSRNKNKEIEQIRSKALSEKQARTGTQVHQNGQTGGRGSASEDLSDSQVHHNSQTSGNRNAAQDLSGISITSKRKRGPTKLQSIHKQIEPIQVDFNPDGEAIAQGGKALGQYIGYLSRDSSVMPLNFDDWRHVPVDVKQEIRNLLEAKFIINWVVGGRWVNEKLAHRWRNRKSALKTKYYESRNDEETINGLKNEVGENQWDWLVKFWESEKGQQSNDPEGKEPNMITMFTVTHTKKNGQPVDSNSREAINQMNELVNQQPNASKDQIFNQVVGEHTKSTLTYGHGIRRVDVFGTQSFRNESLKMLEEERSRRQAAENELKNMQEEMNGVKSTLAEVLKYVRAQNEANAIETFDS
ncbi:hypothetical protein KPL71_023450 [Citrus sinensis]|uniref:Uncharacterized protein n=1 Tax=Citrus sinensis TaxID=2711 RepID=A0ACB8IK25_CITSI|nr:hypothetical protein KPL71_023450 [Citrus sinensis]